MLVASLVAVVGVGLWRLSPNVRARQAAVVAVQQDWSHHGQPIGPTISATGHRADVARTALICVPSATEKLPNSPLLTDLGSSETPFLMRYFNKLYVTPGEIRTPDHVVRSSPPFRELSRRVKSKVVRLITRTASALSREPAARGRSGRFRSIPRMDQQSGRTRAPTTPRA